MASKHSPSSDYVLWFHPHMSISFQALRWSAEWEWKSGVTINPYCQHNNLRYHTSKMLCASIECSVYIFTKTSIQVMRYCMSSICSSRCLTFTWLLKLQCITFRISSRLLVLVENNIQLLYWLTLTYTNPGFCSPPALLWPFVFHFLSATWQYGPMVRMVSTIKYAVK